MADGSSHHANPGRQQHRYGDAHVFAPRSRFLPDSILDRFERVAFGEPIEYDRPDRARPARVDVGARLRGMWTDGGGS